MNGSPCTTSGRGRERGMGKERELNRDREILNL